MIIRFLCFAIFPLAFQPYFLKAQKSGNFRLIKHSEFKLDNKKVLGKLVGEVSGKFYFLLNHKTKEQPSLIELNESFIPTGRKIELYDSQKGSSEYALYTRIRNQVVGHLSYIQSGPEYELFVRKIDLNAFEKAHSNLRVKSFISENYIPWFISSDEGKCHALVHSVSIVDKTKLKLDMIILNDEMEIIRESRHVLQTENPEFSIDGIMKLELLDSGDLIVLCQSSKVESQNEFQNIDIFSIGIDQKSKLHSFPIKHDLIGYPEMVFHQNKIKLVGLTGDIRRFTVQGIFYREVEFETFKSSVHSWIKLSNEFLDEYISLTTWVPRDIKSIKENEGLYDFKLIQTLGMQDGKTILLAEGHLKSHLMAASINANGILEWLKPIKKDASAACPKIIVSRMFDDQLALIYTGFQYDLTNSPTRGGFSSMKKATENEALILNIIAVDGEVQKYLLADNEILSGFEIEGAPTYWALDDRIIIMTKSFDKYKFYSIKN